MKHLEEFCDTKINFAELNYTNIPFWKSKYRNKISKMILLSIVTKYLN